MKRLLPAIQGSRSRDQRQIVVRLVWWSLVAVLMLMPLSPVMAQESDDTVTPTAPTEISPPEPTEDPTVSIPTPGIDESQVTPSPVDLPASTEAATPDPTTEPTATPTSEPMTATPTSEPPPEVTPSPEVSYRAAIQPICRPDNDTASDLIQAGSSLTYRCHFDVDLLGANLAATDLAFNWKITAEIDAGWSLRLLGPSNALQPLDFASAPPDWTAAGKQQVTLRSKTLNLDGASDEVVETLQSTTPFEFLVKAVRPACSDAVATITLGGSVQLTLPDQPDAQITRLDSIPEPLRLSPINLAIAEVAPTVTILDVAIDPIAFSLTDQVTHGTVTILVENPQLQCRDWSVSLQVNAFVGENVLDLTSLGSVGDLEGAPGDGYTVSAAEAGQILTAPLNVSQVLAYANAGQYTQTIGFDLVIPGQVSTGSYRAQVSVSVDPAQTRH